MIKTNKFDKILGKKVKWIVKSYDFKLNFNSYQICWRNTQRGEWEKVMWIVTNISLYIYSFFLFIAASIDFFFQECCGFCVRVGYTWGCFLFKRIWYFLLKYSEFLDLYSQRYCLVYASSKWLQYLGGMLINR